MSGELFTELCAKHLFGGNARCLPAHLRCGLLPDNSFVPIYYQRELMREQIIRAPILNPRDDGSIEFFRDGVIHADSSGTIAFIGEWTDLAPCLGPSAAVRKSEGIILPPLIDAHIHIPQHPIRGQFMEGVKANPPEGRLLAGLNRNVFPTESKCSEREYTERIVREFLDDTLSKGVVGGAAYMTVHADACAIALEILPPTWRVGLVLMNQNCPEYLRTDEANLERDIRKLAARFGSRFIVTDRFAVAVDSPLRQRASKLAGELGLRMQTHLNEQTGEKQFVEKILYPDSSSYTDIYRLDGLLDRHPIMAHCIHMRDDEFSILQNSDAVIAHCPTSNTLLGSGIMSLDQVIERGIDYSICTDVGASPTTSMLCEMSQFLKVHHGRSVRATASEALYRSTRAPARMLGLDCGALTVGKSLSMIEVQCDPDDLKHTSAEEVILAALLDSSSDQLREFASRPLCKTALDALEQHGLDIGPDLKCLCDDVDATVKQLDQKVTRVTMHGKTVWSRSQGT
jgi:guanine deaminase